MQLQISVCIPTKNEEKNLGSCLSSLRNEFDDVWVVDSGSTDGTIKIAKEFGAKTANFQWNGEFPKKRNWALRNLNFVHPWVLFLDADESVTPLFIQELHQIIPHTQNVGFWLSYTNYFMNRELLHGDPMRKLALFRRDAGEYEQIPEFGWSSLDMEIHEHPVLQGMVGVLKSKIEHRDYRGLQHYIAKHNEYSLWEAKRFLWLKSAEASKWSELTPRQRFKYRNLDKWWLSHLYFWGAVLIKRGFLDGRYGWNFACLKRRYFQEIRLKIIELRDPKAVG
ncbi:MAG: glycosyltransferase family 2 protein [Planctomycetes bacterium]|nr:glycosyltransferase family 2 protein [Planctomycetota bacterium]